MPFVVIGVTLIVLPPAKQSTERKSAACAGPMSEIAMVTSSGTSSATLRVVVPRSELFVDARGIRSARRLLQERFEHVLVDVGRRADFDVSYVLAIAFEKASWVL